MMTVPISVIIPTMNRPDALERTLNTYVSGSSIPEQIIIVDQTQSAELKKRVEDISKKYNAYYIYRNEPSSTAARNAGQEVVRNNIIIFSDDDVDVYDDTIQNVNKIMQNEDIALIAGLDDNTEKSKTNIGYILGTKSFRKREIGHVTKSVLGRYPDTISGEVETEWAMGYFFVCRKENLDKWNIQWDERLISYAYAEDLDFSYRYCKKAHESNLRCILTDKVRVKHMVSKEYRIPSRKSTYMYVIHRRYINYKTSCGSSLAISWCDFWRIVERVVKKETPGDFIEAIRTVGKLKRNGFSQMENIIRNT